jgi:DNA-binding Lrp family transcriptional regulator
MHANSLAAFATVPLSDMESKVLAALSSLGGIATDRQIAKAMGSDDPNIARPRITTLVKRGILREVGSDLSSGRKCRLVERT